MEYLLTGVSIRNIGLKTLLPEVERYLVRCGDLSIIGVLPALGNFYQFCLIISATLISPLFSGFK